MTKEITIRVADWSETPGGRERKHGPMSAVQFCEERLYPSFEEAIERDSVVVVDLDGTAGFLPSFIEETFGGLARKYGTAVVVKHLRIVCSDDPLTLEDAWEHVKNPRPPKRPLT
jgi:hypothetical protein